MYQRIIRHWRVSHFEAMYRFSLPLAFAQLAALRELDGHASKGATWAELAAARALEHEQARLMALYLSLIHI
jgi:hypothetical protein